MRVDFKWKMQNDSVLALFKQVGIFVFVFSGILGDFLQLVLTAEAFVAGAKWKHIHGAVFVRSNDCISIVEAVEIVEIEFYSENKVVEVSCDTGIFYAFAAFEQCFFAGDFYFHIVFFGHMSTQNTIEFHVGHNLCFAGAEVDNAFVGA